MKILLVNTNFNSNDLNNRLGLGVVPIGLTYVSYPLKKLGHDVDFFDVATSKNPEEEFDSILNNYHPDIVGYSIRNVDNQSMIDFYSPLPRTKKLIKKTLNKNIITVLGGSGYSMFPEQILKKMNADYGISGQGEKSFSELVETISNKTKKLANIAGLCYRKNNKTILNIPDNSGYKRVKSELNLFNYSNYNMEHSGAIIIKTGCPYNCTFCDTPSSTNKFLPRDHEEIIEEIKLFKKTQNINSFYFIDNCFCSPIDYAKELLYKIIKADINIKLFCQISSRKNCFDDELFELYKKAGGTSTFIGADNFSKKMLKNYNNGFTLDNIYKCSKLAEKHKVIFDYCWLIGGPGEDLDTIKESINFLKTVKYRNLLTHFGIRITPGNPLRKIAIKEGFITENTDLLHPAFYFSKLIPVENAIKYIKSKVEITAC
jgi:radical SAM superfamily enzyme YgiQ (UPF0313 family)